MCIWIANKFAKFHAKIFQKVLGGYFLKHLYNILVINIAQSLGN